MIRSRSPLRPPSCSRPALCLVAAFLLAAALGLGLGAAAPARAQPAEATVVPAAETAFDEGLDAYRRGAFADAAERFLVAAVEYGYTARTTAAYLMAGKAFVAAGEPDRAAAALTTLVGTYPRSRYAPEAERLLREAVRAAPPAPDVFDLAVVLPAAGDDGYLAQALFNGVRLAVDEHNAAGPARPVRLVFRESGGAPEAARAAVAAVAAAGAEAIVGPLFSSEAVAAAEAAEAAGLPLVAPLATDEAVTAGRRLVFQANPTFAARGRFMARVAAGALRLGRLGAVAEAGTAGETMAAAFVQEARALGAEVAFDERIAAADWERLPTRVGAERMGTAQAVYFPVTGRDAAEDAAEVLRGLETMGVGVRPLGNLEWEGLAASRGRASQFGTLFSSDFHLPGDGSLDPFTRRYRALAEIAPDRLALVGYDVTRMLLDHVRQGATRETLPERLRAAPPYQGLAHRFDFSEGNVNRALFLLGYRDGRAELVD